MVRCQEQSYTIPTPIALFIAHQICHGLEYAHTRTMIKVKTWDLVHRDLSPANILLSYTGEVKIADFGIAKAKKHAEITNSGVLKGKYRYMSPEQAHGATIDHRSDIFAVGILLYELLTGQKLFDADNDKALLDLVKACDIVEPRKHNASISPRLNKIICRALHRNPNMRYQSAKDLQEALSEEIHPQTVSSLSRQLTQVMNERFAVDKKRDRERRKTNRDIAWEEHNTPAEELDIDLDDIIEDGTIDGLTVSSSDTTTTDSELYLLQDMVEKERLQKLFFVFTTIALILYILLT